VHVRLFIAQWNKMKIIMATEDEEKVSKRRVIRIPQF
jgi:hypothetical protein